MTAPDNDVARGTAMLEQSFRRLQLDRIDLVMLHDLNGIALFPVLREWKQAGRIRYIGVSTSSNAQHAALAQLMREQPLDVIQVNYSVGNRASAEVVLPLAADRGLGVMINVPFGGRRSNVVAAMANRPLPGFAAEIGATS